MKVFTTPPKTNREKQTIPNTTSRKNLLTLTGTDSSKYNTSGNTHLQNTKIVGVLSWKLYISSSCIFNNKYNLTKVKSIQALNQSTSKF